MPKITTEDCKNYLAELFKDTHASEWKRTKKYKTSNGVVARDFEHPNYMLETIYEKNGTLSNIINQFPTVQVSNTTQPTDPYIQTIFNPNDVKAIQDVIDTFLDGSADGPLNCLRDDFPQEYNQYKNSIPNCFGFHFYDQQFHYSKPPEMTLDKPIGNLHVSIFPLAEDSYDEDVQELLEGLLPIAVQENSACIFSFVDKKTTLHHFVREMMKAGFQYDKEGCLYGGLFDECNFSTQSFQAPKKPNPAI